jgi:hypothetical protein
MWDVIDPTVLAQLPRASANGVAANGSHSTAAAGGWSHSVHQLERFRVEYAQPDWDGQGAVGVPHELVDGAVGLANTLDRHGVAPPAWTVPGPDGTVSFQWNLSSGTTVEIEVSGPMSAEVFILVPGRPAEHRLLGEGAPAR